MWWLVVLAALAAMNAKVRENRASGMLSRALRNLDSETRVAWVGEDEAAARPVTDLYKGVTLHAPGEEETLYARGVRRFVFESTHLVPLQFLRRRRDAEAVVYGGWQELDLPENATALHPTWAEGAEVVRAINAGSKPLLLHRRRDEGLDLPGAVPVVMEPDHTPEAFAARVQRAVDSERPTHVVVVDVPGYAGVGGDVPHVFLGGAELPDMMEAVHVHFAGSAVSWDRVAGLNRRAGGGWDPRRTLLADAVERASGEPGGYTGHVQLTARRHRTGGQYNVLRRERALGDLAWKVFGTVEVTVREYRDDFVGAVRADRAVQAELRECARTMYRFADSEKLTKWLVGACGGAAQVRVRATDMYGDGREWEGNLLGFADLRLHVSDEVNARVACGERDEELHFFRSVAPRPAVAVSAVNRSCAKDGGACFWRADMTG